MNPSPGNYKLIVRAIDGKGRIEGWEPREIFPNGATGQQALSITVT